MDLNRIHNLFFVGIGGIGMSALAAWFHKRNCRVAGYDRAESVITNKLINLGIEVHYTYDVEIIPKSFNNKNTLVVYTPAIAKSHSQLVWFRENNFEVLKRAEVLGIISRDMQSIAVSGTHGKTSVSTLITHLLCQNGSCVNAFLGGISNNFESNLVYCPKSNIMILEADEFDRSFLQLSPHSAVITHIDADHLDIYGTYKNVCDAFIEFAQKIKKSGSLIYNIQIQHLLPILPNININSYSAQNSDADYYAKQIEINTNGTSFTLVSPEKEINKLFIHQVGNHHLENAVVALAIALNNGASVEEVRKGLKTYAGVKRRYETVFRSSNKVYIDDYAHHPREIDVTIKAARMQFPGQKITGVFQPHLFSRTKDFAQEFAEVLSQLDELILLDIYPAREKPIIGVDASLIIDKVTIEKKILLTKEEVIKYIAQNNKIEVLITMGAGDIDRLVEPIKQVLQQ